MSCYKCGKELPENQVECDPPCLPESECACGNGDGPLPKDLKEELARGKAAAKALIRHMLNMGCFAMQAEETEAGKTFKIFITMEA